MKVVKMSLVVGISAAMLFTSCASLNKTQKGAVVGTATGGAMGAVVGNVAGNTALGAIIGAAVGGTTGAIIGHKMDKQAKEIEAAIPEAKVERVGEGIVVEFNSNILFGFDKSGLTYDAKSNLNKLVSVLNSYPDTDIELQGHTDSKGSENYNRNLSIERASAVSSYLSSEGIRSNRVSIRGFGEELPKYDNDTENGRAQNRRVEFLITANDKMKSEAAKDASN
ncbi:MAG: OmpA/MotB domain-containing protein [Bacteroidetes bacterium]|nr:MAG: OmpA/MotB domain-containing protein [Bacteroidota bacterium]